MGLVPSDGLILKFLNFSENDHHHHEVEREKEIIINYLEIAPLWFLARLVEFGKFKQSFLSRNLKNLMKNRQIAWKNIPLLPLDEIIFDRINEQIYRAVRDIKIYYNENPHHNTGKYFKRDEDTIKIKNLLMYSLKYGESLLQVYERAKRFCDYEVIIPTLPDQIEDFTIQPQSIFLFSKNLDGKDLDWNGNIDDGRILAAAVVNKCTPLEIINHAICLKGLGYSIPSKVSDKLERAFKSIQEMKRAFHITKKLIPIWNNNEIQWNKKPFIGQIAELSQSTGIPFVEILEVIKIYGLVGMECYHVPENFPKELISNQIQIEALKKDRRDWIEKEILLDNLVNISKEYEISIEDIYTELLPYTELGIELPEQTGLENY